MSGWQKLWQDPEVVKLWESFHPLPEVVAIADRLQANRGARVLDIGCGLGRHTVYLAARGFDVIGLDNAPAALSACRANLDKAGVSARLLEAEMTEIPFADGHFDAIVATHVIHHTDGPTVRQIMRLITDKLTSGGLLVWAMPSTRHANCGIGREIDPGTWVDEEHEEGPIPHHYFSETEVRELLRDYDIESMHDEERAIDGREHVHWRVLARKRAEQ